MDKKFVMSIAAMAALTLVSCSSDDLDSISDNSSKNEAISFDGYLGRSAVAVNGTRGSEETKETLIGSDKGFGVFGYYNSSASDHNSTPEQSFEANLFNNQQVTCPKNGADWTYDNKKYWPSQGHIDFLAYAPYDANTTLKKTTETEPKNTSCIDFTVSETIANQTDLLWANAKNRTKDNLSSTENNKVKFQFAHALSRLGYTVKLNEAVSESEATITLKRITLAGSDDEKKGAFYKTGTIDLSKTSSDGLWTNQSSDKQNFNLSSSKTLNNAVKDAEIKNSDNEYLFVIPQKFKTGSDQLYVIVEYTIEYKTGSAKPTVSYKVSQQLQYDFEQGKAYTINLTIGLTPIEFNADVTGWDTTTGTTIDASWN